MVDKKLVVGLLSLLGGFICHVVLGTLYMWGNTNLYVRSYFCYKNYLNKDETCEACDLSVGSVQIIFPFMFQSLCIGVPFGVPLSRKITGRVLTLIMAVLLAGSIFVSSYSPNFTFFSAFYGILFGLFSGILYMVPINIGYNYFPNNKGLVAGFISSGYGFGSMIFASIVLDIVNPDDEHADEFSCFPREVADKLPKAIRICSLIYLIGMAIAGILITHPEEDRQAGKKQAEEQAKLTQEQKIEKAIQNNESPDLLTALKQPKLYVCAVQAFCLGSIGMLIGTNYKAYGVLYEYGDKYLTWVGNGGGIINSFSRIGWGLLMDKFSIRTILLVMSVLQLIIIATFPVVSSTQGLYILWVFFSYATYGGNYSIFPALMVRMFGKKLGSIVYTVIFQGFSFSSWVQFLSVRFGVDKLGDVEQKEDDYQRIYYGFIALPAFSIIIGLLLDYSMNWGKILKGENYVPTSQSNVEMQKQQQQPIDEKANNVVQQRQELALAHKETLTNNKDISPHDADSNDQPINKDIHRVQY